MMDINEILSVVSQIEQDSTVPKNVKTKIKEIIAILQQDLDVAVKSNKILQELDDIADDPNMPTYTRTQIWSKVSSPSEPEYQDVQDYIELETEKSGNQKAKIIIKPFIIENFDDIKDPLDALREGYTIALVNIRPIKEKDIIELKRAVNKLKKTCDAIDGDIAGFGEDWIVATPNFAQVHRSTQQSDGLEQKKD